MGGMIPQHTGMFDPKALWRKIQSLEAKLELLAASRRAVNITITSGGVTVDGGSITVINQGDITLADGGSVRVRDGGEIQVTGSDVDFSGTPYTVTALVGTRAEPRPDYTAQVPGLFFSSTQSPAFRGSVRKDEYGNGVVVLAEDGDRNTAGVPYSQLSAGTAAASLASAVSGGQSADPTSESRVELAPAYAELRHKDVTGGVFTEHVLRVDNGGLKFNGAPVPGVVRGTVGRKYRIVAGAVRNVAGVWAALDDSGHRPAGVASVTADSTGIRLVFDAPTAKITSLVCGADETYAARGLRVGASVALDSAKISCYQDNEHRLQDFVSWDGTAWSSFNGVFTGMTFSNGALTLNHEDMGTALGGSVSARPPSGGAANTVAYLGGMGATFTTVELRTPSGVVITGLANPTRLWVERAGLRKASPVNPANLTEAAGNIWFIGLIED